MTGEEIIDALLAEVSGLGDAVGPMKRIEIAGRLAGYTLALKDRLAAANDRASRAVVALADYQERIHRYQARLQSLVDEGTPEAAVHAERALVMLGEELRRG